MADVPAMMIGVAQDLLIAALLAAVVRYVFRVALADASMLIVGHDMIQSYNWESFNRRAFDQGLLPLWNPYIFGGFPALADIQTQALYPPGDAVARAANSRLF